MLLPVRTASENIRSDSPNLADIRRLIPKHGEVVAQAILIHALNELKDLVNVGKNLTNAQIAYIASRIMRSYWMLKPEEVKFVLYRAVEREKLFDRLDPNLVLGWFADYDNERTEEAMRQSDQEALQRQNGQKPAEGAISWDAYVNRLWNLAYYADPEAVEKLSQMMEDAPSRMMLMTAEQKHRNEFEFQLFRQQYNQRKK